VEIYDIIGNPENTIDVSKSWFRQKINPSLRNKG
jgi:hypothetical protein